jgi:hypothetical protein
MQSWKSPGKKEGPPWSTDPKKHLSWEIWGKSPFASDRSGAAGTYTVDLTSSLSSSGSRSYYGKAPHIETLVWPAPIQV